MFPKIPFPPIEMIAKYAFWHAIFTAFHWFGPLMYVALGLGFKGKEKWTIFDEFLAIIAMPTANILTTPGRFIVWDGIGGLVISALITSATWGILLAVAFAGLGRWNKKLNMKL